MSMNHIIHVNDSNFQYEVINYSQNTPVIIEFWASWSRDCRIISPMLEKLATESGGIFRLAKIDVDASPNLALLYNIRSVPAIKAISNGHVIREFFGLTPESKIRELIAILAQTNSENLTLEKANNLLLDQQWALAAQTFQEFLNNNPNHTKALLGLGKSVLAQNNSKAALYWLKNFPISREAQQAEVLLPLAEAIEDFKNGELPTSADLDIPFKTAIRLFYLGNYQASLDGLLSIIKTDQYFREGKPRKVFLSILELMGSQTPEMRAYQQELTSLLF